MLHQIDIHHLENCFRCAHTVLCILSIIPGVFGATHCTEETQRTEWVRWPNGASRKCLAWIANTNISNRQGSHKFNFRNEHYYRIEHRILHEKTGTTHHLSSRFISFFVVVVILILRLDFFFVNKNLFGERMYEWMEEKKTYTRAQWIEIGFMRKQVKYINACDCQNDWNVRKFDGGMKWCRKKYDQEKWNRRRVLFFWHNSIAK